MNPRIHRGFRSPSGAAWCVRKLLAVFLISAVAGSLQAQDRHAPGDGFTHADSLAGMLTPARTCYDVRFYHLDVTVDPARKTISGANTVLFSVVSPTRCLQLDLFANLRIDGVFLDSLPSALAVRRDSNAFFVDFPDQLKTGSVHSLRIAYSGTPITASLPPWQGGFTWTTDSSGHPWVAVTCEGTGASCWWPVKEHLSDKPDSVMISVTVPDSLEDVSNGRLRSVSVPKPGWKRYDWFVSYPINTYNVTLNIGRFAHFSDVYLSQGRDTLTLDYYVLPLNLEKARRQFTQVRRMLDAFEWAFGPYPFVRDGYKLIESPHNGMEHQSAVAYGNNFADGYRGHSSSEEGLAFDFIIVHESAHEWWGNSVTARDAADMWIHESFGAYAEALFVEHTSGRDAALRYINGKKQNVRNMEPIAGVYNVRKEGSGEMYDKGQLFLNTLRSVVNDDSVWIRTLRGIQSAYRYQAVDFDSIAGYFSRSTGIDCVPLFEQYIRHATIPVLECIIMKRGTEETLRYRWKCDVERFAMPVRCTLSPGRMELLSPTTAWQSIPLKDLTRENFQVATDLYYISTRISWVYTLPR